VISRRILVIDDDEDVRGLLGRILRDNGYAVETRADGEAGLEAVATWHPHLVILDVMMPGLDGWGVLAEMKRRGLTPPVILLSATADQGAFARGVREGAAAYVSKPFRFKDLLATCLRAIAERENPTPPLVEFRRGPRRTLMVEAEVRTRFDQRLAGELANLGAGGAQVLLETVLARTDRLRLSFRVPGAEPPFALDGEVRWQRSLPRGQAHGIAFVDVPPSVQARLEEMVRLPSGH
jgi:CheY-like chemotaxis protein